MERTLITNMFGSECQRKLLDNQSIKRILLTLIFLLIKMVIMKKYEYWLGDNIATQNT